MTADEECSHESYNIVHSMMQHDVLLYLHPEKFATRRSERQSKKKELVLDSKQTVSVRDRPLELQCSASTELEMTQAMLLTLVTM